MEVANGPITPTANKILLGHNKLILPDIFINAGSTIISYLEYIKNMQRMPFGKVIERYWKQMFKLFQPDFYLLFTIRFTSKMIHLAIKDREDEVNPTLKKMLECSEQDIVYHAMRHTLLKTLEVCHSIFF